LNVDVLANSAAAWGRMTLRQPFNIFADGGSINEHR
jgi:hypothetical protein